MIAAHEDGIQGARLVDPCVRICAISNHISQIPDRVVWGRSRENGGQSFEIGVNIGKKKNAHRRE